MEMQLDTLSALLPATLAQMPKEWLSAASPEVYRLVWPEMWRGSVPLLHNVASPKPMGRDFATEGLLDIRQI